ncbi:hypothetical protein SAMN05421753_10997 [Planctomicrobium piriforme]|uniref:Transposase IS200 like n=2 Tax=Planctomicrobium piriforme TaxID=1576369 RepID=A0A1I3IF70_9PLAN|nr:hypothetical protein SAMN05421753_10997 [Planctomicrobium piriforme]
MWNHVHLVVDLREECPDKGLADLKAYGSRAFNNTFGKLASGRWWTEKGSTRFLKDEEALHAAMDYVLHRQPNPLAIWPTTSIAENSGR